MLSLRLNAVAQLIDACDTLVDIGSDHGYLPLELIKQQKVKQAIICELRKKPLDKAILNFQNEGFSSCADFILSDGLQQVSSLVENVSISGMGFETILKIIKQDLDKFRTCQQIILQSNTKVDRLRLGMYNLGFTLVDEVFVKENKHAYIVLKYKYSSTLQSLDEFEISYGPILLKQKNTDYFDYLKNERIKEKELSLYDKTHQDKYDHLTTFLKSIEKV